MSTDQQTEKKFPRWLTVLLAVGIGVGCLGGCFAVLVKPWRPAGALLLDAMFAAWMAYAARGAGWRRIAIAGVLVFAALVGIEMAVFRPDLRRFGVGVILAVLCATTPLFMRAVWPTRWVSVTSAVVMVSLGGLATLDVRTTLVGALLIFAAIGVAIHLLLGLWVRRHSDRTRRRAAVFAVVVAVLMPLGVLAYIADKERHSGAYAARYGTQVAVITGDVCRRTVYLGGWRPRHPSALRCPAIWDIGDGYQTGTAYGDGDGFGPGKTQMAYAVGDEAWHTSLTDDDGLTLLGRVLPGWVVLGLIVGLVIAVVLAVTSQQPNLTKPFRADPSEADPLKNFPFEN